MKLTAGGSCSMWNSWSKLDKESNLQGWSTQKPHSLGVFYFGLGVFKGCNALLWKLIRYDLRDFQNFQGKPNFSGVFKNAFPQQPCLLFFFLEQATDRKIDLLFLILIYPAQCTGLELLPEPLQNKICYRLHTKFMPFSCFLIICSSATWKSLFLRNRSYAIFDILKEADWMLFQPSADNFCNVPTILLHTPWKYKYWCIQKGLCDAVQPLDR